MVYNGFMFILAGFIKVMVRFYRIPYCTGLVHLLVVYGKTYSPFWFQQG